MISDNEKLVAEMREVLANQPEVCEKRMFGGICWTLRGHMLSGVNQQRYMFRVGIDYTQEALARPGASPMDITGRVMRGLVWVDPSEIDRQELEDWARFAAAFVDTLPEK